MKALNLLVHAKFFPGDEVHEVFLDTDIDAWNTSSWKVDHLEVAITSPYAGNHKVFYVDGDFRVSSSEDNNLFRTSLEAANEAKRRNNERIEEMAKDLARQFKPKSKSKKK